MDNGVGEAQGSGALPVDSRRPGDASERGFADRAVVTDPLDVQETSVGLKADFPQGGEVRQSSADLEVVRVVDGRLRPERAPFCGVLLDAGVFVIDVAGGRDTLGDHPGPKAPRRLLPHPPSEDELDLVWAAAVTVFPNHLVEEDPAGQGAVEYLGQAELGLQDRELIAVAGPPIAECKRVRQARQPLVEERLDRGRRQSVAERLQLLGRGTREDPVIQSLIRDPTRGELALDVLMPVETELGVVRDVGAELQEDGPEVPIHAVEVVVVHHGGGADEPGIRPAGLRVATALGAEDWRLLLGLADDEDPLSAGEPGQGLGHHVVLSLTFLKGEQRHLVRRHKRFDRRHERPTHRGHQGRGGKQLAAMGAKEPGDAALGLEPRHIRVEVQAVDAFDFQRRVLAQDLTHRAW